MSNAIYCMKYYVFFGGGKTQSRAEKSFCALCSERDITIEEKNLVFGAETCMLTCQVSATVYCAKLTLSSFSFCGRGPFPPHGRRSSDTAVKRGERRKVSRHFRRERKISENAHSIICAGGDQEILVVTRGEVSADKVL